ncbi:YbaK/EbsC family protein [Flexibacterium corallicola]|uniref:YbaK/EbsC family protein n=1 Tax=Flexibacterium corallicola TaxID=3037259 RepID=UPI00286EFA93|nr:YbaK/EbsC family protein [Pseudovibrio sp. M1P-2-3]
MSKSTERVKHAAQELGLNINVQLMPTTTRTAEDAANACKCEVGQIVKSLIFEGIETEELKLLLVSGAHTVNLTEVQSIFGESLIRANPKKVREQTGFSIGGVAPIGHLKQPVIWMDRHLMQYESVWAAAGAPNAVFNISPTLLQKATQAQMFQAA